MRRAKGFLGREWSQLTGRIEANEAGWEAAARELREETGILKFELFTAGYCDSFYNPVADNVDRCLWPGLAQTK
jgi:dATP pyrophosphohydrolase